MRPAHTDSEYEAELRQLREELLLMAGRVESMISNAVASVLERDVELARNVIAEDRQVDRAEVLVDDLCLRVLAKRQPVASDLRFLTQAFKMVTDLERIGDLAVNICERAVDLSAAPELKPHLGLARMGEIVQTMVRDAIDSFVDLDADKGRAVIARDNEVDALYQQVFRDTLQRMVQDASVVERGIHVQSVAKWLERMADHATNIAEHVIFVIDGEDLRHAR